ncbi:MAG: hypothetical protein V4549_03590, partial [Bacteroidota bacterium]
MAKQRLVKTSFWDEDEWVQSLNSSETLLYLYLITCPKNSLCGIFKVLTSHIKLGTKLSEEEILKCFKKFENDKKIILKDEWIILVNRKKHQNPSPKISRGIERELLEIPQEIVNLAYGIDTPSIPKRKSKVKVKSKVEVGKVFSKISKEYEFSKLLFDLICKNNISHSFNKLSEEEEQEQIQDYCADCDAV